MIILNMFKPLRMVLPPGLFEPRPRVLLDTKMISYLFRGSVEGCMCSVHSLYALPPRAAKPMRHNVETAKDTTDASSLEGKQSNHEMEDRSKQNISGSDKCAVHRRIMSKSARVSSPSLQKDFVLLRERQRVLQAVIIVEASASTKSCDTAQLMLWHLSVGHPTDHQENRTKPCGWSARLCL